MPPDILWPSKALSAGLTKMTHADRGGRTLDELQSAVEHEGKMCPFTCADAIDVPSTVIRVVSEDRKEGFAFAEIEDIVRSQSSAGMQERAEISRGRAGVFKGFQNIVAQETIAGGVEKVARANPSPYAKSRMFSGRSTRYWRELPSVPEFNRGWHGRL
jgi:hypothetical protein